MFKRTAGYVLLIFLVVTGLASQVTKPTLTAKERRFLIAQLKTSREELLARIEDLNKKQMNFKPARSVLSLREQLELLALAEVALWQKAHTMLQQEAVALPNREPLSDEEVLARAEHFDRNSLALPGNMAKNKLSPEEALRLFEEAREAAIKFARTTTGDVRSHLTETTVGTVDGYGMLLLISSNTRRCTRQMTAITSHPRFPK